MDGEELRAFHIAVRHDGLYLVCPFGRWGEGEDTGGSRPRIDRLHGGGLDGLAVYLPCVNGVESVLRIVGADEDRAAHGDIVGGLFKPPVEGHLLFGAYPYRERHGVCTVFVGGGEGEGVLAGFLPAERIFLRCGDCCAVHFPFECGDFGVIHFGGEGEFFAPEQRIAVRGNDQRNGGEPVRHDVYPHFGFVLSAVVDDLEQEIDRARLRADVGEGGFVAYHFALYRPAIGGIVSGVLHRRREFQRFIDLDSVNGFVAFEDNPGRFGRIPFGYLRTRCGCTQESERSGGCKPFHLFFVFLVYLSFRILSFVRSSFPVTRRGAGAVCG